MQLHHQTPVRVPTVAEMFASDGWTLALQNKRIHCIPDDAGVILAPQDEIVVPDGSLGRFRVSTSETERVRQGSSSNSYTPESDSGDESSDDGHFQIADPFEDHVALFQTFSIEVE